MISISVETRQMIPVVHVNGRLDSATSLEFEQALQPLIATDIYLIVGLSECKYLSSAGIRILLLTEKKLLAMGGGLFLSGVVPEVYQVFEMAGLHRFFRLLANLEAALCEIERIRIKTRGSCEWTNGSFSFQFHQISQEFQPALLWKDQGIAGYNELNLAVGTGWPCESPADNEQSNGVFISTGRCAGFVPDDTDVPPDFRIPQNPDHAGIFTGQAVSFSQNPAGLVRLVMPASILPGQLAEGVYQMKCRLAKGQQDLMALVVVDFNPESPAVLICLLVDSELREALRQSEFSQLSDLSVFQEPGLRLWGARFVLDRVPPAPKDISLENFLENTLSMENIVRVDMIQPAGLLVNPIAWMLMSEGFTDASLGRLRIETDSDVPFEPYKAFLMRRLYTDSGRLVVKPLHGGYSAQTFQVTSFDQRGRKLRPTVLKIGGRAMISRESDCCQQFALPYILNNSAIVLGTEFFGDTGALRYNFVGIGGEQTQLKWLTHYYLKWPTDQLKPLFDKIFLQILNPWYGQPVRETIFPFKDHDPRATFFPKLCEIAAELLLVNPDDQYFTVPETGQTLINPYWFLKYEFTRRRDTGIDYFTSICHGDLNMQNILLDEDMNVYLIDFSETKPRSVVSDFARLEAIFMVDNAPVECKKDEEDYINFISAFYAGVSLDQPPVINYQGIHRTEVDRNVTLSLKMRQYSLSVVNEDTNPIPYCLALLEWILPIVCYGSASAAQKRLSMIVSGLLCNIVETDINLSPKPK